MAQDVQEKEETLTQAVTKAVESQDKSNIVVESNKIVEEGEEEKEEEGEGKERKEEKEEEEDEDTVNGRMLIQALKDPTRSAAVIDYLAKAAGYTKQNVTTKDDVKEAKEDIEEILAEHLGEEFKFLAPKLAPAIKQSLNKLLEGRAGSETADLKARLDRQEYKEIQNETAATHKALAQEWFGSDDIPNNVAKAMSEAMDEFPPTDPNMTAERYYRRIFSLVAGEMGLSKKGKGGSDRAARSREDSVARNLTSQNKGVSPTIDGGNPKKMSLKDSVALALEQVEQASRK